MGRTARQGTKGSFSMVLSEEDLEIFQITPQEIETARQEGKLYSKLHEKRLKHFEQTFDEKLQDIDAIMENHRLSQQFLQDICDSKTTKAMEYLTRFLFSYIILSFLYYYRYVLIAIYFALWLWILFIVML